MENLNQLRAKRAFSFIEKNQGDEKLMTIVTRLSEMFHTNGLLATFAFLMKKQDERGALIDNLLDYLRDNPLRLIDKDFSRHTIFDENAGWVNQDNFTTSQFFNITNEMINYATWLKRAAEALDTD